MSSRVGRTGRLPQCSIGAGETIPSRLWDGAELPSQLLQREIAFALITRPAGRRFPMSVQLPPRLPGWTWSTTALRAMTAGWVTPLFQFRMEREVLGEDR